MADISQVGTHISSLRGRVRVQAGVPENPDTGDLWFDSDTNTLMVYNGTNWVGGGTFTTSTSTSTSSTSTSTTA